MHNPISRCAVAHIVDPEGVEVLHVLGPTIQVLTGPDLDDQAPCVMRGTIPPGVIVPLHSHPDPETFFVVSGEAEGLVVPSSGRRGCRSEPVTSSTFRRQPSTRSATRRGNRLR